MNTSDLFDLSKSLSKPLLEVFDKPWDALGSIKDFILNLGPTLDKNIYVAGAKLDDGVLKTAGGRVLGVTEVAETLEKAIEKAYETVQSVNFDNAYYRKDIGKKALAAKVN